MLITIVIFGDGVKNHFFETYSEFDIILKKWYKWCMLFRMVRTNSNRRNNNIGGFAYERFWRISGGSI